MNFKTQAQIFLIMAQSRKRNPLRASTVLKYQSDLNTHILPFLGEKDLGGIENGVLKALVSSVGDLAPSTIQGIASLVKQVISSAVDQNGNELYPRKWNNDFIDLPPVVVKDQNAPTTTFVAIQEAISATKGADKALVAFLAGTGLRISEALNLTSQDWNSDLMTVNITKSKTDAGVRTVDLPSSLNSFLKATLDSCQGPLFGGLTYRTADRHLQSKGLPPAHSLRRFRLTHLDLVGVPRGLAMYWSGHAARDVHDLYVKAGEGFQIRKDWAERAGLGFELRAV
jgi:integrase